MIACLTSGWPALAQDDLPTEERLRLRQERQAMQELQNLRQKQEALRISHEASLGDKRFALDRLRDIDAALAQAILQGRLIAKRLLSEKADMGGLLARRQTLELRLATQKKALGQVLRSAFLVGKNASLRLLLAPERTDEIALSLAYHRYLHRNYRARIEAAQASLEALEKLGQKIEIAAAAISALQAEQSRQVAEIEALRRSQENELRRISERLQREKSQMRVLGHDREALEALLAKLKNAIADISAEPDKVDFLPNSIGNLSWPVAVPIDQQKKIAASKTLKSIVLQGSGGSEIAAVAPGRVAFADWFKGYGLLLIIDHGQGYMSLYGHNEALLKEPGDWVARGEAIATVGNSGGNDAPGVYFELRHQGQSLDLLKWLQPVPK